MRRFLALGLVLATSVEAFLPAVSMQDAVPMGWVTYMMVLDW